MDLCILSYRIGGTSEPEESCVQHRPLFLLRALAFSDHCIRPSVADKLALQDQSGADSLYSSKIMSSARANLDISRAWAYHNATKHSPWSIRSSPHFLDWDNRPLLLKIYPSLDAIPLPADAERTGVAALAAIASKGISVDDEKLPSLDDLTSILYFSAGITRKKQYPRGEMYFRAASCTGALYEFELYLVCGPLPDLAAGVYHFGPGDHALRLLRPGDYRGLLANATAGEQSIIHAPIAIISAGTYWRNAWKYRARTYRHFGWDNGTILANMLAMAAALELPARVVLGFVDSEVNRLLDLDTDREVAFSITAVGHTKTPLPETWPHLQKLGLPTIPLSQYELDYPELRIVHAASSLETVEEVEEWRTRSGASRFRIEPQKGWTPPKHTATDAIERVILRRGSSRKFEREPITVDELSIILKASTQGVWADFALLNELYLIVHAVDGLAPGAYFYDCASGNFERLKEGIFRDEARHLGLGQDLSGDAAANVFFLCPLDRILEAFGNRGYRAVQLEAGILGGRMYLAAYAQRLGATGLTFFDDDVIDFFSPHASGKAAVFLVALGKSRKSA
jgi:SagB-type dehydrogenase family enzyme